MPIYDRLCPGLSSLSYRLPEFCVTSKGCTTQSHQTTCIAQRSLMVGGVIVGWSMFSLFVSNMHLHFVRLNDIRFSGIYC